MRGERGERVFWSLQSSARNVDEKRELVQRWIRREKQPH